MASLISRVLTPYSHNQSSSSVLTRANLASNLTLCLGYMHRHHSKAASNVFQRRPIFPTSYR